MPRKGFTVKKKLALKPKECEFGDAFYTVNSGTYLTSEPQFLVCRVGIITTVCSNELKDWWNPWVRINATEQ